MPKVPLFLTVLFIILSYSIFIYFQKPEDDGVYRPGESIQEDRAVNQAKHVYASRKALGDDFSLGPCLSDALMPNWVADIVHNPRQPIDDEPAYQCPSFIEGKVKHIVELDPDGNVVRVK